MISPVDTPCFLPSNEVAKHGAPLVGRERALMPASVVVVSTPEHRAERLAKLNLKEEHFRNAIIAGENARSICTGNHPALYRGMKAWGEGTRTLRDETAGLGTSPTKRRALQRHSTGTWGLLSSSLPVTRRPASTVIPSRPKRSTVRGH